VLNFAVALVVSRLTAPPPESVQRFIDNVRLPG
jgi:Na+(H+)/acetate symporter ActP